MITYPYLAKGRKIEYVPLTSQFMAQAKIVRDSLSTDKAYSTGVVIVKSNQVIGRAGNQAGFKHPFLIKLHQNGWCIRRKLNIKSGEKYWLCPGCATNKKHAENLAINNAINNVGVEKVKEADLYLYGHWWCCEPCWNAIIKAEIKHVYLLKDSETLFNIKNPKNIIKK